MMIVEWGGVWFGGQLLWVKNDGLKSPHSSADRRECVEAENLLAMEKLPSCAGEALCRPCL